MPITITTTPVVAVAGRTANYFGVGEIVDLRAAIVPAIVRTPIWRWNVTLGSDVCNFSFNGDRARVIFTSLSSSTVTISLRDAWDDTQTTITLHVIAPTDWSLGPSQYDYHEAGRAHAAFRAAVQIHNQHNVSFDNLEMREGNAMPLRTGRYVTDNVNVNNHHQATFRLNQNWIRIGNSRTYPALQATADPGHIALAIDRVSSHGFGPPFTSDGTFTWRIPWTYRLSIPVGDRCDVNGTAIHLPDRENRDVNNVIAHQELLVRNSMTISKGGRNFTYNATQAAIGTHAGFNA